MSKESGFSVLEFLVSMVVLVIVFGIVLQLFVPIARSAKSESKSIQTQIEGIIGLEMLRRDIVHAGVGLPWAFDVGYAAYNEASASPANSYNDTATGVAPRAIIAVNGDSSSNPLRLYNSDYLVLKSVAVADTIEVSGNAQPNPVVDRWTTVYQGGNVRLWNNSQRDPATGDRVVVIQPSTGTASFVLKKSNSSSAFFTTVQASQPKLSTDFAPTDANAWYAFAVSSGDPQRPFNRADYYISNNASLIPARCAPGTGVLVKSVLKQDATTFGDPLPLLDCVADFQVVIGVDNQANNLSQKNCLTNPTDLHLADSTLFLPAGNPNADAVRADFKEIRVYVLAQEGAFNIDWNTTFPNDKLDVGEADPGDCDAPTLGGGTQICDCKGGEDAFLGEPGFDMTQITNYKNYRWRVYRMVIKPESLTTITSQ